MKVFKNLVIYKFCSLGGVEKVIFNRAVLYKKFQLKIKIYLSFIYEDAYTIKLIKESINKLQINNYISIINYKGINQKDYDLISSIDTPEVFDQFDSLVVECHSTYMNNIRYLKKLPNSVKKIIVPSIFLQSIIAEKYKLNQQKIYVLQNFLLKPEIKIPQHKKLWNKPIVFYFGRIDEHKKTTEVIEIFKKCREKFDNFYFLLLAPNILEYQDIILRNHDLFDRLILKTGISFLEVNNFLLLMKAHKAIFLSATQDESFGFSAAETLLHKIPAVLSDIPAHRFLCQNNESFLYKKTDIQSAANKIINISNNYDEYSQAIDSKHLTDTLQEQHLKQIHELMNI